MTTDNPPEMNELQAALAFHQGPMRFEYARRLKRLVHEYPDSSHVLGALAWHCVMMRHFKEAAGYYRHILELAPSFDWAKDLLRLCEKSLQEWDSISNSLNLPADSIPAVLDQVRNLLVLEDSIPPHEAMERWEVSEHFLRAAGLICLLKGFVDEGIRLIEKAEQGVVPLTKWEVNFMKRIRNWTRWPVPRSVRLKLATSWIVAAVAWYESHSTHRRPPWALFAIAALVRDIPDELVHLASRFRLLRSPAYPFLALERALYEWAVSCQPNHERASQGLFLVACDEENSPRAEQIAMELVEAFPDNVWNWLALGYLRCEIGDVSGAQAAYRSGIQRLGADVELQVNQAVILAELGEPQTSFDLLQQVPPVGFGIFAPFLRFALEQPPPGSLEQATRIIEESFAHIGGNNLLELGGAKPNPLPPGTVCPWCGGTHLGGVTRIIRTGQNIAWCENCDYYHVNPQPALGDVMQSYNGDYLKSVYTHAIEWMRTTEGNSEGVYGIYRNLLEWLEREPKVSFNKISKGLALDVGCAVGTMLTILERRGWHTIGVEPSQDLAEAGRTLGRDIRLGFLEHQNFESGQFDLVTAMHVLEHVHQPSAFLQEVARVTRSGGFLLLCLPVAKVLRHYLYGASYFDQDDHLSFFSLRNIGKLLSECGYESIAFRTAGANDLAFENRRSWTIPPSLPLERKMADWGGETFLDVFARKVS